LGTIILHLRAALYCYVTLTHGSWCLYCYRVLIVIFIHLDHIIQRHDQLFVFADISFLVSDSAIVKLVSGMISGFRHDMAGNCALLVCFADCSGNFLLS